MSETANDDLQSLPSVDRVLREIGPTDLPRPVVVAVIRRTLADIRRQSRAGKPHDPAIPRVQAELHSLRRSRIEPVINATGIIIHTNLGRSPLSPQAATALTDAAQNYTNLEYDLQDGQRGHRGAYAEHNLAILCNADRATVVNNCAAALLLILRHYAATPPRNRVVISRGELIQIGGGFRIPDILAASGADLHEIGTTNKTTLDDYRQAIDDRTALVLKVHRSNFFMEGFVEEPPAQEIARLAREAEIPFAVDLGSGATFNTATFGGNEQEPTPAQSLAAGATLVCFSGDKLLGGPQAGIIAGTAHAIAALKKNPLFRALRCDKLILAALQATVDQLLTNQTQEIPIRNMIALDASSLETRARKILTALTNLPLTTSITAGHSQVGGGSLPRTTLNSVTITLTSDHLTPPQLAAALRNQAPPVIAYIADNEVHLDLRTVFPRQDPDLIAAVRSAVTPST